MKKITISHKRDGCIGCGSCALLAPCQWTMNKNDGKSDLKNARWHGKEFMVSQIDEDELEENIKAADACPVNVIRVSGHND